MRFVWICAIACACSGGGPPPPTVFAAPSTLEGEIAIDLDAIDAGPFRFKVDGHSITPEKIDRRAFANGMLVRGTFGTRGTIAVARVGTKVTGVVREGDEGFEIVSTPAGPRFIRRNWKNPRRLHDEDWAKQATRGPRPRLRPVLATVIEIDVLFAYTKAVLAKHETIEGIASLVQLAVDDLNTACANSGVNVKFNFTLSPEPTTSTEGQRSIKQLFAELRDKQDFADAHARRKERRADILMLLVDRPNGPLGYGTIMAEPETAVGVVDQADSIWYVSVAHEIGHMMGGLHEDDELDDPFAWGHGYVGPTGRTIMANPCFSSKNCLVLRWSNPEYGNVAKYDVARVLRETADAVSKFGDAL